MFIGRRSLALLCLFGFASAAIGADTKSTKPEPPEKPGTTDKRGKAATEPEFITKAIDELKAEMEAVIKDPAGATIREKSNYFATSTETLPEAELVKILGKRIDRNAAVDSYVKWQLLSIQKSPFGEEAASAAFKVYRSAVVAPPRPGTGADSEMQGMLRQVKKENYTQANSAWGSRIAAHNRVFGVVWRFRDELYNRLPKAFDVIRAGFDDADARMQRGYDAKEMVKTLSTDLRALAAGAKPAEIKRMVELARYYSTRQGSQTYDELTEDKGQVKWKTGKPAFDKKSMEQLAKDLEEISKLGF